MLVFFFKKEIFIKTNKLLFHIMSYETIKSGDEVLAIVVRKDSQKETLNFVTPPLFPIQVGYHNRTKGSIVQAHEHIPFEAIKNMIVQEFFYVILGKLKVNIFHNHKFNSSVIVNSGDSVLLNCGHGFEFLERTQLVEVKQGPYRSKEKEKKAI